MLVCDGVVYNTIFTVTLKSSSLTTHEDFATKTKNESKKYPGGVKLCPGGVFTISTLIAAYGRIRSKLPQFEKTQETQI